MVGERSVIDGWRATLTAVAAVVVMPAQGDFEPARYRAGEVPGVVLAAVGGGEVFAELAVDSGGSVRSVTPLRVTPPFTDPVVSALRRWVFRPASVGGVPVESAVFVAAVYRPPALLVPSTLGEIPKDVATPAQGLPFPESVITPPYPPNAHRGAVVLLEARLNASGAVAAINVVRGVAPFDEAARSAASQWRFRPARREGTAVPARVYLVFGFREPVTEPPN